ncbi:N-succinyl-L-ornithine transcarbamylase [Nonlabens sp. Hel1_33_55]|uniref:acetylornithine carbamoyltransferase n=1 Tax=Nonlabens sp. Hel1_33_55 TaxID=1336802 RepID=UPI000875B6FC|nr:acetylornithine carbamoyltransferase [Nonlabens sp. Hel1_33_55]SCY04048.1 N-succinyl-L-ornithine transcarbamylase [Nonlabens sp. Hel1_33_55]
MKHYSNLDSLTDFQGTVDLALQLKADPYAFEDLGKRKTIALVFFNSSLRTRLSTEKAARNLGMDVMVLNVSDSWNLEFGDGTVMNMDTAEHIKEATKVIAQYADIIAVRAFAGLKDKDLDYTEKVLNAFIKHAGVPIVNMESALFHPLQGLTDAVTIKELVKKKRPKVVLSWAPHPRALPHAVPNSFVEAMKLTDVDLVITNPEGYDLDPNITKGVTINHNQKEALKDADVVYVKNWSSFEDYGEVKNTDANWMMTKEKLGKAIFMHCLPVRRNVVVVDAVLDSDQSVVITQAGNRTYAAQAVLKLLLDSHE